MFFPVCLRENRSVLTRSLPRKWVSAWYGQDDGQTISTGAFSNFPLKQFWYYLYRSCATRITEHIYRISSWFVLYVCVLLTKYFPYGNKITEIKMAYEGGWRLNLEVCVKAYIEYHCKWVHARSSVVTDVYTKTQLDRKIVLINKYRPLQRTRRRSVIARSR